MATHSSILAWKIPWIDEPGGLQSTGSQKLDTTDLISTAHSSLKSSVLTLVPSWPLMVLSPSRSNDIKRHLVLGRQVMTNLDSILKSRDITLPTKVRLVKAMVFPVVMYGCESWTVKKAERRRIDAFEL